jgi:phosphoenolpyruvate-protein phosphotransferase (PTS system enzyme I)
MIMETYRGISAHPGIAIGPAFHFNRTLIAADERELSPEEIDEHIARVDVALERARSEMDKITKIAEQKAPEQGKAIFEAQRMMLDDPFVIDNVKRRIREERRNGAYIVDTEFSHHQHFLATSENPLFRERADDVEDIKQRLLRHLMKKDKIISKLDKSAIVVAELLTPADAILFARQDLLGFATDAGGATSHVAILARSMGLPAIVGLRAAAAHIETGDLIILDGRNGELIVKPDEETLSRYRELAAEDVIKAKERKLMGSATPPVFTKDGREIAISMNMELISEEAIAEAVEIASPDGKPLRGLGLLRTEHFLTAHDEIPSEEEQSKIYCDLAAKFNPSVVTIRTFDIGGDKFSGGGMREKNPFLGWRGIRISLDEPVMFIEQIRAILRASAVGNVRMMLPMITSTHELDHALRVVDQAKKDLRVKGEAFNEHMPVGVMIEVPAAALRAEHFANRCDFLSIGSNDLTQYTLAVDRGNEFISHLFDELHPAVLQLIDNVITSAHRKRKPVSLCGEMGSKDIALPFIIGLGLDEISVSPTRVMHIASLIRSLDFRKCRALVRKALKEASSTDDVKELLHTFLIKQEIGQEFAL